MKTMPLHITVREATYADITHIDRLADAANMGSLSDGGDLYVAESADDRVCILGFIRIFEAEGEPYVYPIVVDKAARRLGIGRTLMEYARKRYGRIQFVARGAAVPFYDALDCERISWSDIAREVTLDCDECSDRALCHPQPMAY